MESDFIPYKQALALKELGFDEPCFGYYENQDKILVIYFDNRPLTEEQQKRPSLYKIDNRNSVLPQWATATPTYSQAFRWFRKKHKLLHEIRTYNEGSWLLTIYSIESTTKHGVYNGKTWDLDNDENYVDPKFYEEAELLCLNKLVEIVKENNDIKLYK